MNSFKCYIQEEQSGKYDDDPDNGYYGLSYRSPPKKKEFSKLEKIALVTLGVTGAVTFSLAGLYKLGEYLIDKF
jgi:hypothetical protein